MPDTLKNLISSVDWSKLMASSDAKNALVGSVLGGLMLGGAGLAADRDPEESKYAPVGDALMGAVLGGAAGYGIPKGLALFRDSGSLAPDDDTLSDSVLGNALSNGVRGYGVGAGIVGLSAIPTYLRTRRRIEERAQLRRGTNERAARINAASPTNIADLSSPDSSARSHARRIQLKAIAHNQRGIANGVPSSDYKNTLARLEASVGYYKRVRKTADPSVRSALDRVIAELSSDISVLENERALADRGHLDGLRGLRSVWGRVGTMGRVDPLPSDAGSTARIAHWFNRVLTDGGRYARTQRGNYGRVFRPGMRLLGRMFKGKIPLAAALLAGLGGAYYGANARDNFKN